MSLTKKMSLGAVFIYLLFGFCISTFAAAPLVSINVAEVSERSNKKVIVYDVINNSKKSHNIQFNNIEGASLSSDCGSIIGGGSSCKLTVVIDRDYLTVKGLDNFRVVPVACLNGSPLQCYQPSATNILYVTVDDLEKKGPIGPTGESGFGVDTAGVNKSIFESFTNALSELLNSNDFDQQQLEEFHDMLNQVSDALSNHDLSTAQDLMKDINELMSPDCGSFCM